MENVQQPCKLCGNNTSDKNYKIVDDVLKDIFDVLLLKLSFNKETRYVMCKVCFSKTLAAFEFKSTCLYTDDAIVPYVDLEMSKPGNLKEIYEKEKGYKHGNSTLSDLEICRLCFQTMSRKHRSIQEVPVDDIRIYIPEINFALTTSTEFCLKCYDLLCLHSTFIKKCLTVEGKSNTNKTLTGEFIKTEEIHIKSEDEVPVEVPHNDLNTEKNEEEKTSHYYGLRNLEKSDGLTQTNRTVPPAVSRSKCNSPPQLRQKNTYTTKHEISLTKHLLTHKDPSQAQVPIYRCGDCDFKSAKKRSWKAHQLVHKDPSQVQMYKCYECQFKTMRKRNLTAHVLIHKNSSQLQMLKCNECDYKAIHKSSLKYHQLSHMDPSQVRMYECEKCEYKTKNRTAIRQHLSRHRDPLKAQMYCCNECDYKSIHKVDLKRHQVRHKDPSELKMYGCDECEYKSHNIGNLKRHQFVHKDPSQAQTYKCEECNYVSVQKRNVVRHLLSHKDITQVPTYACENCNFVTKRRGDLRQHELVHKDPSEVKMYKCSECEYETKKRNSLRQHLLIHKDPSEVQMYACDKCSYETKDKPHLKRHQSSHDKLKFIAKHRSSNRLPLRRKDPS